MRDNFSPKKGFHIKENHIGSMVIEIFHYTERPVIFYIRIIFPIKCHFNVKHAQIRLVYKDNIVKETESIK